MMICAELECYCLKNNIVIPATDELFGGITIEEAIRRGYKDKAYREPVEKARPAKDLASQLEEAMLQGELERTKNLSTNIEQKVEDTFAHITSSTP